MLGYFNTTNAQFRIQSALNRTLYVGIARLLLDFGLDANSIDLINEEPLLFTAIRFDDVDMVELLLHYVSFKLPHLP